MVYYFGKKKREKTYLIIFAIFAFYLLFVLAVTLFPIPLYSHHRIDEPFFTPYSLNLIPFYFGECQILRYCIMGSVANVYLTIPFGFGINFLKTMNKKERIWLTFFIGFSIEITQLLISIGVGFPYRAIDINDVILNASGILIGYGLFKGYTWIYLKASRRWTFLRLGYFAYLQEVANQNKMINNIKKIIK